MASPAPARPRTFQDLIASLKDYWAAQGCVIVEPYDMEVGAGTFHQSTFLRSIGNGQGKGVNQFDDPRNVAILPSGNFGEWDQNARLFKYFFCFNIIFSF